MYCYIFIIVISIITDALKLKKHVVVVHAWDKYDITVILYYIKIPLLLKT